MSGIGPWKYAVDGMSRIGCSSPVRLVSCCRSGYRYRHVRVYACKSCTSANNSEHTASVCMGADRASVLRFSTKSFSSARITPSSATPSVVSLTRLTPGSRNCTRIRRQYNKQKQMIVNVCACASAAENTWQKFSPRLHGRSCPPVCAWVAGHDYQRAAHCQFNIELQPES